MILLFPNSMIPGFCDSIILLFHNPKLQNLSFCSGCPQNEQQRHSLSGPRALNPSARTQNSQNPEFPGHWEQERDDDDDDDDDRFGIANFNHTWIPLRRLLGKSGQGKAPKNPLFSF